MSSDDLPLPPLQRAWLSEATLDQLFFDIAEAGELLDLVLKGGLTSYAVEGRPSLDEARRLLSSGRISGIQLRYRYRGSVWWDTLLRSAGGVELVRIEQTTRS